jgi:hypothetical protein
MTFLRYSKLTSSSLVVEGTPGVGEAAREGDEEVEDIEVRVSKEVTVLPSDREVQ